MYFFKKFICTNLIILEIFSLGLPANTVHAQNNSTYTKTNEKKEKEKENKKSKKKVLAENVLERVFTECIVDGSKWVLKKVPNIASSAKDKIASHGKEGFNTLLESKKNLSDIISENSGYKLYGQDEAKNKMFSYIMSSLYSIDEINRNPKIKSDVSGNVIYLIGPSGCGKTTMAKAVANAILKDPNTTLFFIDPSAINPNKTLDKQLFKTLERKDIKNEDAIFGILDKEQKSPILEHLSKQKQAVIIIDDYDKMKLMHANQFSSNTYEDEDEDISEDRTADEVLKSIAENGKYFVEGNEIDCRRAIFLVTSNESTEILKQNFGVGGGIGGGYQRLKIVEFDNLSLDACKKIIQRMLCKAIKKLTDFNGPFKLNSFDIDEKSINDMANDIYMDKANQGRLERTLYSDILDLFSRNIGEEYDRSFKVTYTKANGENLLGTFEKTEVDEDSNFTTIDSCAQLENLSNINTNNSSDNHFGTVYFNYKNLLNIINKLNRKNLCLASCDFLNKYVMNNCNQTFCKKILVRLVKQIEQGNWINKNVIKLFITSKNTGTPEVKVTFEKVPDEEVPRGNLQKEFSKAAKKIKSLLNER